MSLPHLYRWPTKLKKFGISDPFLKILATKYENEIPWQIEVRDAGTLVKFVEDAMLPRLLARTKLPVQDDSKNHFYITRNNISLEAALNAEFDQEDSGMETIENLRAAEGDFVVLCPTKIKGPHSTLFEG